MKKLILFLLSSTILLGLNVPNKLKQGKPGKYTLKFKDSVFAYARSGVEGMYYIPRRKSKAKPSKLPNLIVFYHGNTRNKRAYRKIPRLMLREASKKGFHILSVQNWWSLSKGYVQAAEESRIATNAMLSAIKKYKVFNEKMVITTGFSAGGLTALLVCLNSLDSSKDPAFLAQYQKAYTSGGTELPSGKTIKQVYYEQMGGQNYIFDYAGFASFKGNYYEGYIMLTPFIADSEKMKQHYKALFQNKIALLLVGGRRDAKRVQKQQPQAYNFIKERMGISNAIFKKYPRERHNLSRKNWNDFYKLIENLNQTN